MSRSSITCVHINGKMIRYGSSFWVWYLQSAKCPARMAVIGSNSWSQRNDDDTKGLFEICFKPEKPDSLTAIGHRNTSSFLTWILPNHICISLWLAWCRHGFDKHAYSCRTIRLVAPPYTYVLPYKRSKIWGLTFLCTKRSQGKTWRIKEFRQVYDIPTSHFVGLQDQKNCVYWPITMHGQLVPSILKTRHWVHPTWPFSNTYSMEEVITFACKTLFRIWRLIVYQCSSRQQTHFCDSYIESMDIAVKIPKIKERISVVHWIKFAYV